MGKCVYNLGYVCLAELSCPQPRTTLIYPGARLPNHLHQEEPFVIDIQVHRRCYGLPLPTQIMDPIVRWLDSRISFSLREGT